MSNSDLEKTKAVIDAQSQASYGKPVTSNTVSAAASRERPQLGEIVFVDLGMSGKAYVKPGIVTAVHGPYCVNVRVLDDGSDVQLNSLGHKCQVPAPSAYSQPRPRYWFARWEGDPI